MVKKMNDKKSVLGTVDYLNGMRTQPAQNGLNESAGMSQKSPASNKIKPENKSISAAAPHLKQFAGLLSEEIANKKKIQEQELERIRAEEIEKIRLEEEMRIQIAAEARLKAEIIEKERIAEEKRLEEERAHAAAIEEIREQIRLEELAKYQAAKAQVEEVAEPIVESVQKEELQEELLPQPTNNIDGAIMSVSGGRKSLKENEQFVTFEDLKTHYADFINKINVQLGSLGGGGEVLLSRLDDVDMATVVDGDFISYDATTGKFVGGSITPEGAAGGVLEGGEY